MPHPRTISISLIRHAPTIYPKGTLPPADPDVDLSNLDQINRTAGLIPPQAEWWISPLSRCQKTADALIKAGATPAASTTIPSLAEQDYGDWHGQEVAEIWGAVKDGPLSNWHFLHPSVIPPNGESFEMLVERIAPVLDKIIASSQPELVLIAHGMVIRALIGLAMRGGEDVGASLAIDIAPLSFSRLTYMADGASNDGQAGGRWMMNRLNNL